MSRPKGFDDACVLIDGLPDDVARDQPATAMFLRQNMLWAMAEEIERMTADEYEDFLVNEVY